MMIWITLDDDLDHPRILRVTKLSLRHRPTLRRG